MIKWKRGANLLLGTLIFSNSMGVYVSSVEASDVTEEGYQYHIEFQEPTEDEKAEIQGWLEEKGIVDPMEDVEAYYEANCHTQTSYPGKQAGISESGLSIWNHYADAGFDHMVSYHPGQPEYSLQDSILSRRFSREELEELDIEAAKDQCNQIMERYGELAFDTINCYTITNDIIQETMESPGYSYQIMVPGNVHRSFLYDGEGWSEDDNAYLLVYKNGMFEDEEYGKIPVYGGIGIYYGSDYAIISPKYGIVEMHVSKAPIIDEKIPCQIMSEEKAEALAIKKLLEDFKRTEEEKAEWKTKIDVANCDLVYQLEWKFADLETLEQEYWLSPYWKVTCTVSEELFDVVYASVYEEETFRYVEKQINAYSDGMLHKNDEPLELEILIPAIVKSYTYDELKEMSGAELYQVFVDNGLDVSEVIETFSSSEVLLGEVLKMNLDAFAQGICPISSVPKEFVNDVKEIYHMITKE